MKINNIDHTSSIVGGNVGDKKIKKSNTSSFSSSYNQAEKDNQDEYIKKTLKNIEEKGELLKSRLSLRDFMDYKSSVSELLSFIMKNSYEYSRESKLSRGGNYRVFGIIKQINEELEKLGEEFLKEEKDKIKIIDSISGIKGLIMDMSM